MSDSYEDIIRLPHPVSKTHPRMDIAVRAAQFSPFAALTGHDAAIRETARLTDRKLELDEDAKLELDRKLQVLRIVHEKRPEVSVTHFIKDPEKEGGSYETVRGHLKKIDDGKHEIVLEEGIRILIEDIFELESELFALL